MKTQCSPTKIAACMIALAIATGCASTKETERKDLATGNLMQPNQIWVYNFAAMPAEVAAQSALAGQASQGAAPLTAQQIAEGRKLGSEIAAELIQQIKAMGLPATNASTSSKPQVDDVVIQGSLLSIQQGSAGAHRVPGRAEGGGGGVPDDGPRNAACSDGATWKPQTIAAAAPLRAGPSRSPKKSATHSRSDSSNRAGSAVPRERA